LPPAAVQPNFSPTFFTSVAAARAAGTDLTNGTNIESLATQYRYNSLNQVIAQQSPDGGKSQFWYDRLGRLAVSQNAKQAGDTSYSYTLYDPLGRITEVGQKPQTAMMTQTISQDTTALPNWLNNLTTGSAKVQITRTYYDIPYMGVGVVPNMTGLNLRNRVAYSMVIDVDNINQPPYRAATFYSYDPHGNVDSLLQDYGLGSIMSANNRFKLMVYNYDLISGKVNQVSYQPGQADAFYHQYSYDAENRITSVRTSTDSIEWQNDASYTYYRHGPLARTEIGDLQLQGIDYAYTVQGWLKSINPSWVTPTGSTDQYDSDGVATPAHFERDAYKLNLNYFDDGTYTDFTPIAPNPGYVQGNGIPTASKRNLYNGNIGSIGINIRALATSGARDAGPMLYNYGYDQLNRITKMDAWNANGSFRPAGTVALPEYAERYGYDPNGNILTLNRNGDSVHTSMDQLSYKYIYAKTGGGTGEYVPGSAPTTGVDHLTNQLSSIQDAVTGNSYTGDIKTQAAFNYQYDAIGELTDDDTAKIHNITWNVYGKLLSLSDTNNTISFTYDAAGNRISKLAHGITTWYVRDAKGGIMSVYSQGNTAVHGDSLTQTEAHLYGSSRLGLLNLSVNCASTLAQPTLRSLVRGNKLFELTNHLGNVLVTISDKKIQHSTDSTTVSYYTADVTNANDYYSFGMQMPARSFAAATAGNYRYGFNGKEQDPEVKGPGGQYDYGMRVYDPRVGRFMSVDPLKKKYPELTPYQFASNTPIQATDLDGKEGAWEVNMYLNIERARSRAEHPKASDIKINIEASINTFFDLAPVSAAFQGVMAPLNLYEYTNRNNNQRDPKIRAEDSKMASNAAIDVVMGWGAGQIMGSTIKFFKGLAEQDVKYLFRGTSEDFEGSAASQKLETTPTSSDPVVATIFSIESKNYGKGVVQIVLPSDLQGVEYTGSNVLGSLEHEIGIGLKPSDLTKKVTATISSDQARGILKNLGINLPSKISVADVSATIENTPRLTSSQTDEFYKQAIKIANQ
jgi:RHS repeat-associated protein